MENIFNGLSRESRTDLRLYIGDVDVWMSRHSATRRHTFLKRRGPTRFKWVSWADQPPNTIQRKSTQRFLADVHMSGMWRIK